MGLDLHVIGYAEPDDEYNRMKALWDEAQDNGTDVPDEVQAYFDWREPEGRIRIDLRQGEHYMDNRDCDLYGYDILIKKLPPEVTMLRVYLN